jgi:uncharacterized protein YhfF
MDDSLSALYQAANREDLMVKVALLEAGGIRTRVFTEAIDHIYGNLLTGSPMISGIDPLTIFVAREDLEAGRELLASQPSNEAPARTLIAALDWEHRVLFRAGDLPEDTVDQLVDLADFAYMGVNESGACAIHVYLSDRDAQDLALPQGSGAAFMAPTEAFKKSADFYRAWIALLLHGWEPPAPPYEVFGFCGEPRGATELGKLTVKGEKTGTSSLACAYEAPAQRPPVPGSISIVVDGRGKALCAIETICAETLAFDRVGPEHARAEGEGDGSLEHWGKVHKEFFTKECARLGKAFALDIPVICERFKVIHRF